MTREEPEPVFDKTMDVIINGERVVRLIDYYSTVSGLTYPVLNDGEECVWTVGSKTPTIVKVR